MQWDVLCVIEHKEYRDVRLISYSIGYTLCYASNVHAHYTRIVMYIRHTFHMKVIVPYEIGRFIVVEICYDGQILWLVSGYASNVSQERKLLWRALNSMLNNGTGLLMGD